MYHVEMIKRHLTLIAIALLTACSSVYASPSNSYQAVKALVDTLALEVALEQMRAKRLENEISETELTLLSSMFFTESGRPSRALELAKKAEFMTTQFESEIAEVKARAYFKLGDLKNAELYANAAISADQGNISAQIITINVAGELAGTLQADAFEKLLRSTSDNTAVWRAYLDQALRLSPSRLDLADRAYIKLGRSGLATEYRAQFTFLAGNPQRAYQLFLQALTLYRQENNEIAANHIERWLDVHRKYSDAEKKPQVPVEAPQQQLKRENLPVPQLKPAHLDTPTEIEPIVLMTDGDVLTGSGFIANNGNWVITNRHVVEGAERVIVRDGLGRVRYVTEYILDADQDIARLVLSQPYPQSQAINSSDIIDPVAGDELFLMGFPLSGVLGAHHPSITEGIVSKGSGFNDRPTEFLITANLNQGNSGGPIFSVDGRVLGIAVAKLDKKKFLQENDSIPEDVNIGIKGNGIRRFMGIKTPPSDDARPVMSPRDAYSMLRSKVVLVVAIDE